MRAWGPRHFFDPRTLCFCVCLDLGQLLSRRASMPNCLGVDSFFDFLGHSSRVCTYKQVAFSKVIHASCDGPCLKVAH